jgi:benzylsuccinate CoA-transferase BbsF subunit
MGALPLAGLRVTDFTWIGAGSYTTKLLADFGADVIKIETSTRLDSLRMSAPFKDGKAGVNRSGYFADRNTSKRSITLNLRRPQAQDLARRLIARSDIVANNFTPGVLEKFGLGYGDVAAFKPDIIYLGMSMQGATGPDAQYVGFGLTIAALTGLQHLSGPAERPPAGTGTNYPDHVPNPAHAAFAVLAAIHHRRATGEGQFIDLAQTEPTIGLLGPILMDATVNGRVAEREGNRHWSAVPHNAYPCAGENRYIAICVYTPAQWDALVEVLGTIGGSRDWRDVAVRRAHEEELDTLVGRRTVLREARELMEALQARGVAAGVVQNARDLIEADAQLAHRQHWVRLTHKEMGATYYNAPPMRLSRTPATLSQPAPLLGEHTEEVCRDLLGVSADEFARMKADKVFE